MKVIIQFSPASLHFLLLTVYITIYCTYHVSYETNDGMLMND